MFGSCLQGLCVCLSVVGQNALGVEDAKPFMKAIADKVKTKAEEQGDAELSWVDVRRIAGTVPADEFSVPLDQLALHLVLVRNQHGWRNLMRQLVDQVDAERRVIVTAVQYWCVSQGHQPHARLTLTPYPSSRVQVAASR